VLNGCDEAACDRICGVLDRDGSSAAAAFDAGAAIPVGPLVLRHLSIARDGDALPSHAHAIAFVAKHYVESRAARTARLTPRTILAGLRVLDALCGLERAVGSDRLVNSIPDLLSHLRERDPALRSLLGAVWSDSALRSLVELTAQLRSHIPSAGAEVARKVTAQWISSRYAGILLLAPIVQALGWPQRIRTSRLWAEYGERGFTYLLAGVATSLTDSTGASRRDLDPAAPLFAGCLGDLALGGLSRFEEQDADDLALSTLSVLLEQADATTGPLTWHALCARLGDYLVGQFASRIRGFRHSSRGFIVSRFLAVPGRILIEPERILVALDANPLWVAVHLSGADASVDDPTWMPTRRLEFELGGL
jgi:hypothetical protein